MSDQLYVATDAHGVERVDDAEIKWTLPSSDGTPGTTTPHGRPAVLRRAMALLGDLDERIFVAGPVGAASDDGAGTVSADAARLVSETAWDVERAATFALDCAEHVLGDASGAVLPGGATLGEIVSAAREVLERSSEHAEQRLGLVARLAAARRLRRQGEVLGDVAFEALQGDVESALDALDDPAWATVATVRDAVLGAVEAVRHLALPRYVAARESAYEDLHDVEEDAPARPSGLLMTPWGPITLGAEHPRGYAPAWVAARDAAQRARDAVSARGGDLEGERLWQAERLEALLAP